MCWYNLVYITFSRIFEKDVSKEIGLKLFMFVLSPFLYKGFISENFNQQRKIPNESGLLHMYVRGDAIKGVLTFRILIGIPSYPRVSLNISDLIFFSISLGVVHFSFIFEQGSLKSLYRQCVCVCVWNCYNSMIFHVTSYFVSYS
jgi:hypothetical protein